MPRWVDIEKIQRKFEDLDEVEPLDLWVAVMRAPYWDEEVAPVCHGRWIKQLPNRWGLSDHFVCSQCARVIRTKYRVKICEDAYCKHCGAKMDAKEEE